MDRFVLLNNVYEKKKKSSIEHSILRTIKQTSYI